MAIWNAFRRRPRRSPRGSKFSALGSSPRRIEPLEAKWLLASDNFVEFNLVSNQPATALISNPSLVGAWGIASSPGANGAFSVSDAISQRASSFSGDVAGSPLAAGSGQPVFVPMPTGQVYNGAANEFLISPPTPAGTGAPATGTSGSGTTTPQPAEFLYASLDGTIYGFNSQIDPHHAVPAVSVANAAFTGLTIANNGTADELYAADSRGGNIDVFDTQFKPVTTSGSFTDPNLPAGDKPFNIESLGGKLYVTYVSLPVLDPPGPLAGDGAIADGGFQAEMAAGALPFVAASGGVVDAFDANGNFVGRIASGAPLDVPWGMALAPSSFGQFAGDLLVANHGDGKINAFDPSTGALVGTLSGADGSAFVEPGLLGLAVGNGANAGDSGALYFTAGGAFNFPGSPEVPPPALHSQGAALPTPMGPLPVLPVAADMVTPTFLQGLLGTVQVAGSDPLVAVGTNAQATIGQTYTGALAAFGSAETPSPTATGTPAATYTATINWGDGSSTTAGSVVSTGHGGFVVLGAHVYSAAGSENYQVTIQDTSGNSATASGAIQVASAPLLAMGVLVESPTLAVSGATVADFVDTGATDPLANYSATINWGDGTSATAGTIVSASASGTSAGNPSLSGAFAVTGSHTYTATGDYTLTIIISDTDGSQATVESHAHIASATLLATGVPVTSQFLTINGATVADFIDTGGSDPLANYSVTIDWGDGTSASPGTIASSGDHFAVFGSHTYSAIGDYTLTVAITDSDGTSATAGGTASVASATLTAKGLPVESQTLAVDGAVAAVFHDTGGPDPLASYSATIDWGDGSSASAGTVVGFHDFFAVVGSHTYTASGNYNLSITILDTDGSQTTVQTTAQVGPSLSAFGVPVLSQTLAINGAVAANFNDPAGADSLANYSATIDWGDGTSASAATVVRSGEHFAIVGGHTYAAAGDYTLTVAITDTLGSQATVQSMAQVAAPTLLAKGVPVESQTLAVNGAVAANFIDTGGSDPLANYSASIDWGDQTSATAATIVSSGDHFAVVGSHTYTAGGDYTLTVTITDSDGTQATVQASAQVANPMLIAHSVEVESPSFTVDAAVTATFVDTGGTDPLTNYSATIDWGDQTSATAATVVSSGDHFAVVGSHTYAANGPYRATITITDTDGAQATVHTAVVLDASTLAAQAVGVYSQTLAVSGAIAAVFKDTNGTDPLANYSATIDWGDQTSATAATVVSSDDHFVVVGSHTYAADGHYDLTIAISDTDGGQATVQGTAQIATAVLAAHGVPVVSSGLSADNAVVAAFFDTNGADPTSNYSATIDWGDGSSAAAGSVVSVNGHFAVVGSHTYTASGSYNLTIALADTDGAQATVTSMASMDVAPLLASGVPVVVTNGLAVNGAIVAALADAGGGDPAANYAATIDWGDSSSASAGTVGGSGDSFTVSGSHTYTASGVYDVKIAITDADGSAANVKTHAFVDVSSASFVTHAFQDILHRPVDDPGLAYWTGQIAVGVAPSLVASNLTHSAESYATNVIDPLYQQFLGRPSDAGGVAYWTTLMQQGMTDQQLQANFIGSSEFYARAGGTNAAWVNAMYQAVLGRPADGAGLSYWATQLSAGASRSSVATGFAASQEREAQLVQDDYFTYLGRSASPAEVNYWVSQFEQGTTNEDIVAGFIGSPEYVKVHS